MATATEVDERWLSADEADRLRRDGGSGIEVNPRVATDVRMLASSAYAPLTGFAGSADYDAITHGMQTADGAPWTLPITLRVDHESLPRAADGVPLLASGEMLGTIDISEVYERDQHAEARAVYGTDDDAHPGVRGLLREPVTLVSGVVHAVPPSPGGPPSTPAAARRAFAERGWQTVVAFQTRNPVHRAHEHITKLAMEQVDGMFLHPLSGETKGDDVPFSVRLRCYEVLLDRYYPKDRVVLGLFPAAMRYAGPREAVFHGLVRRNYGCSHFIIGRDAAGVGSYYGPYDAHRLYDELGGAGRLGFTALKFGNAFYCPVCEAMATDRTCPHDAGDHLSLSGTRVRELLRAGGELPHEFTRPEVAEILRAAYREQSRS